MIHCQNCGQENSPQSNFCRACGTRFIAPQMKQTDNNYEYAPPRPYSWKTDEYQTQNEARKPKTINQVQPLMGQFPTASPNNGLQPPTYQQPGQMTQGYRCPRCASQYLPRIERKISTAGWIVFAILLVTFFPLFWLGFFLKEEIRVCPVCNLRIS